MQPKPLTFPYTHPLPTLPRLKEGLIKTLDPWNVWEVFRIEALLRSKTVMQLFSARPAGSPEESKELLSRYGISWDVLEGAHHYYLEAEKQPSGIVDLRQRMGPVLIGNWMHWKEFRLPLAPHRLFLEIDSTVPPKTLLKTLGPLLREQHKQWQQKPPHMHYNAWCQYFRCYDHRKRDGWSLGQIGRRVYAEKQDTAQAIDLAKKAIGSVTRLIEKVEHDHSYSYQPPPSPFLFSL